LRFADHKQLYFPEEAPQGKAFIMCLLKQDKKMDWLKWKFPSQRLELGFSLLA
jgi:hypothetical protein